MTFLDVVKNVIAANTDAHKRYHRLSRGTAILETPEDVDAYLCCYGERHYYALHEAMNGIDSKCFTDKPFEIWDWGCGVGTGTCTLLDCLAAKNLSTEALARIALVEPSAVALSRAVFYIQSYYSEAVANAELQHYQQRFETLVPGTLETTPESIKVHLFSNVIDIKGLDVVGLGQMVADGFSGTNHFVIVSPNKPGFFDSRARFTDTIVSSAKSSSAYSDIDRNFIKCIYHPFPAPGAYRSVPIKHRERQFTAVLR